MALNEEFYDKIVAKIMKEGEPDDLAKFVLSGSEALAAAQRYLNHLEADEKRKLILEDDAWFFSSRGFHNKNKKPLEMSVFKFFTSSIIPFIEELSITNTHLEDYSLFKNIKHLNVLYLKFEDQEYEKVLSGLSSLQSVDEFCFNIKGLNLQVLSSLAFSFNHLIATNVLFEDDPKCDKVFQTTTVHFYGNCNLKNDFVFTRQNYQNYAALFPNATKLEFRFHIKIIDNISDLLKVSNDNHVDEVNVNGRNIDFHYKFYDYSGFPESKVLKMLQNHENWHTHGCPYTLAYNHRLVTCSFPLAIAEVGKRIAQSTLRRIPENSDGQPEDYYRLIIDYETTHEAEFEVLKTASVESLLEAYRKITGIDYEHFGFIAGNRYVTNGTIADNFQNGDKIFFGW